jgi:hypothetical protein
MNKHKKYLREIELVLPTTKNFEKEYLAIKQILAYLTEIGSKIFKQTHEDVLLYEFWKFYRSFKMKEFILLYKERIKAEIKYIDSTTNKTIEMLDRAFLWHITNWSNNSKRKYEQRFYSEMALKFIINKDSYYKLSIANRNILIDLIKEKDSLKPPTMLSNSKKNEKNNKCNDSVIEYLESNKPNLLGFISTNKIEDFKGLIHAFACQTDSKIQLDHVLNRIAIKKYIENLCDNFKNKNEIINEINNAVDLILPYMFGSVVHKSENDKLKSNLMIDSQLKTSIWTEYIRHEIKMYDFDSRNNNNPKLIDQEEDYSRIEIDNPYDSIVLIDKIYKWDSEKKEWIYSTHNNM